MIPTKDSKRQMDNEDRHHYETVISFFDEDIRWWTDVYREDLPRGFFSFEMRRRLGLVTDLLASQIRAMDDPAVLECGCGPGDILASLAPLRCRLTGIDLNQRYLGLASERVPGVTLIEGNVEQLPFGDNSFDIVYAVGLLSYLRDDRRAAAEIARVTKPRGHVLVSVPNYRMLHLLLDPYYVFRFIGRLIAREEQNGSNRFDESKMRRYPLGRLRRLFEDCSLSEIRWMSTSYGPLKFWRKEVLPLSISMRISETLRKWSDRKSCVGLRRLGNHFIMVLRKEHAAGGEVSL